MEETPPFVPVGTDHALTSVVMGVGFNEPLPPMAFEGLASPGMLQDDLPGHVVVRGQTLSLRVDPNSGITHLPSGETGIERVELQRFSNGGQLEWLLGIEKTRVFVACHAYTRWRDVAQKTYRFLDTAFRALQPHRTTANAIVLECIDEFFSMRPVDEGFRSLLREDAGWLAPHVLNSTGLFHSNVGWFETTTTQDCRRLIRLNIEALPVDQFEKVPPGAESGVRITTFLRTDPLGQPFPLAMAESGKIVEAFEAMHVRSKELIIKLLANDMNKRIGLLS